MPSAATPKAPSTEDILRIITGAFGAGAMLGHKESGDVTVVRTGDKIIIPENMSIASAREWLRRKEEAEEAIVAIQHTIPCFPLDGVVGLWRAMQEIFGFTALDGHMTMFGKEPPKLLSIATGPGEFEQVPYCMLKPPAWEGGYVEPYVNSPLSLMIVGEVKKKYEHDVKRLLDLAGKMVKMNSIYKGKPFSVDLSFITEVRKNPKSYDPTVHCPKFLDLSGVTMDSVILNDNIQFEINTELLLRIMRTEECRRDGIPLKHGSLFTGSFGTGKTSTGHLIGSIAEQHGWTFIYSKSSAHLVEALALARQYAPAVLFNEDVDAVVSGDRTKEMNDILEAIDGVEAKDQPVICIFTTNDEKRIHPAFMRDGRIDSLINFELPDAKTAARFVKKYTTSKTGVSFLVPDANMEEIGSVTANQSPAEILGIVSAAKAAALFRTEKNATVSELVTTEDVTRAAGASKRHRELSKARPVYNKGEAVIEAVQLIRSAEVGDLVASDSHHWNSQ